MSYSIGMEKKIIKACESLSEEAIIATPERLAEIKKALGMAAEALRRIQERTPVDDIMDKYPFTYLEEYSNKIDKNDPQNLIMLGVLARCGRRGLRRANPASSDPIYLAYHIDSTLSDINSLTSEE